MSPTGARSLVWYAVVSVIASVVVIAMKLIAWRVSGSVGLLSDALESVVNVVASVGALIALRVSARPADDDHNFGHSKVEYFSAVFEGVMIVVAAIAIIVAAVERLINPQQLEAVGLGLAISVAATVINGAVGVLLLRVGRARRSPALTADGKHLLTDVWTTAGVVLGVLLVAVTGWLPLDSLIAIAVAINILVVGGMLMWRSASGLMDSALPAEDRAALDAVLDRHRADGVDFHDVRTRESGHERFVQMHMLVPGEWSVQRAHDLVEVVEGELHSALEHLSISTHLEPVGDPRAYEPWRMS